MRITGPFSIFGSPNKAQIPSLREPASQTHFFSGAPASGATATDAGKPLPNLPPSFAKHPSFTTPRKLDVDLCSSGAENASSPDYNNNADSEATPDNAGAASHNRVRKGGGLGMGFKDGMAQFVGTGNGGNGNGAAKEKEKERRGSFFGRWIGSPGRGELPRGYSTKVEKKIIANRRRAKGNERYVERRPATRRRGSSETDSDAGDRRKGRRGRKGKGGDDRDDRDATTSQSIAPSSSATFSTLFSFIESHPQLPHILSFYAQLALNIFLVFSFISILWSFWTTIRADVDKKSQDAIAEAMAEMAVCAKSFHDNRCELATRVPAMEAVCQSWERCMKRDPRSVGRARVSAHTFAEIFNSFVEPISYKAMVSFVKPWLLFPFSFFKKKPPFAYRAVRF